MHAWRLSSYCSLNSHLLMEMWDTTAVFPENSAGVKVIISWLSILTNLLYHAQAFQQIATLIKTPEWSCFSETMRVMRFYQPNLPLQDCCTAPDFASLGPGIALCERWSYSGIALGSQAKCKRLPNLQEGPRFPASEVSAIWSWYKLMTH